MPENKSDLTQKIFFCTIVFVVSFAIRFTGLQQQSYWLDEMVSLHFAKSTFWQSIFWDNCPFLYHFFLKFWVALFGDTEWVTRLPSVLFSATSSVILYIIGRRFFGSFAALVIALVHVFSAYSIQFAQETRMYALFEMLVSLNLYYFMLSYYQNKSWRPFAVTAFFLSLTHYLAIVPVGIGVALLFSEKKEIKWDRYKLLVFGFMTCLSLFVSYLNFFKWSYLDWQYLKYVVDPMSRWPSDIGLLLSNNAWWALGVLLLLTFVRFFWIKDTLNKKYYRLPLYFVLLPIGIFLLQSLLFQRAVFLPRYFIYIVPVFSLSVGLLMWDIYLRSKRAFLFSGVTFLLCYLVYFPEVYQIKKAPWRRLAEIVRDKAPTHILTTRTVAIGTPYFERIGVGVEAWDPSTSDGLARLGQLVGKHGKIWIIESFWAGRNYLPPLGQRLRILDYEVSEVSLKTDHSRPILAMLIQKKAKK